MKHYILIYSLGLLTYLSTYSQDNLSNVGLIRSHLTNITKTEKSRNFENIQTLNLVSDYIYNTLQSVCDTVHFQYYEVEDKQYRNVIGSIGTEHQERLIIGAHYDVAGEQEGADDNASGVTGVLELARLIKNKPLEFRIDFVAYTLRATFLWDEQMGLQAC